MPVDESFKAVVRFHLVPFIDKYMHLVGFAKQNGYACEQLEPRMAYEFPDFYKIVLPVIEETFPEPDAPAIDSARKKPLFNVFSIIYNITLQELLQKKIRLSCNVFLKEVVNQQTGENEWVMNKQLNGNVSDTVKLEGQDEILVYFESPVSIHELLDVLKEEDVDMSSTLFEEQRFRLIDFVAEKIVIDGVLEFVE